MTRCQDQSGALDIHEFREAMNAAQARQNTRIHTSTLCMLYNTPIIMRNVSFLLLVQAFSL
jgi:hypothetical protein